MSDTSAADRPSMRFHHRMSDSDALMWAIEKDPMLRSTITTVVTVDGRVPRARVRELFERASRVVPRLRQRVRANPMSIAPPRWEVDPHFDLNYHLRFVRAPGDGRLRDVLALAEPIAMQSFDRARPLWECTYAHTAGGTSAVILKIHHSITDGVGAVKLMLELFDLEADAVKSPMPEAPEAHVLNQAERMVDAFTHQLRRGTGMLRRFARTAHRSALDAAADPVTSAEAAREMIESTGRLLTPATSPLSPIMTGRSLSTHFDVIRLPLPAMKAAGHAVDGKLNDAFVAGILLGIRRYHLQRGAELRALRMSMPINLRDDGNDDVAGNAFVPARFEVPVDTDDPRALMEGTHHRLLEIVHEPANALVEPMANLINRLPTTFSTALFGAMMKGLDLQASNVPGSPFPLYLCGVPVTLMVPFGPMAGAAANITLLSYVEELEVGVNVDPAAVTDPAQFVDCLRQAFQEIIAVEPASPRARHRTRPSDATGAAAGRRSSNGSSRGRGGRS